MIPRLHSGFRQRAQFLACPEQPNEERLSNGPANASTFSCYRHRALFTAAQNKRVFELGLTGKSEGVVKTEISWAVREHRLLCQRRLRTKTLEISPESLCGGVVPPTIDST